MIERRTRTPHPGRGANLLHPKYGPVWATSHLGSETISFIGTDPEKHKENAWKVVQKVDGQAAVRCLSRPIRSRKTSTSIRRLNTDAEISSSVAVFKIRISPRRSPNTRCFLIGQWSGISGRAPRRAGRVQQGRNEVWFSVWNNKAQESAIVVIDDKTLALKTVIRDKRLVTADRQVQRP